MDSQPALTPPPRPSKFADLLGIDPRALAVFRMALGALLLVDLAVRVTDLRAMYCDGVFSIDQSKKWYGYWNEAVQKWLPDGHWSLHWLSDSVECQAALMVLTALFAVALLLGYWTRIATIGCWLLVASLHVRNPLILNAGDILYRMMLFWAIFLPLGRVWSLDARGRIGQDARLKPVVSVATVAILVQLCLLYWFTGWAKVNEVWLGFDPSEIVNPPTEAKPFVLGGNALYYVCAQDLYAKPLARMLLDFPYLLRCLSVGTVALELLGPALLFVPWFTRQIRSAVIASFIALHLGIELTIHVGLFSYVTLALWVLFVPASVWSFRRNSKAEPTADDERPHLAPRPSILSQMAHVWASLVCLFFVIFVTAWVITGQLDEEIRRDVRPRAVRHIAAYTMTHQGWGMFGRPTANDWWFVYDATLRSGRKVDPFRGGRPVDFQKPHRTAALFPNHRWRKLHRHLLGKAYSDYRLGVARYLVRDWNRRHGPREQIVKLDMICLTDRLGRRQEKPRREVFATVTLPESAVQKRKRGLMVRPPRPLPRRVRQHAAGDVGFVQLQRF